MMASGKSICKSPKNPTRKPKPKAPEFSGSKVKAASLSFNFSQASFTYIYTNIIVPSDYIGPIMELCQNKRGIYKSLEYIDDVRVNMRH